MNIIKWKDKLLNEPEFIIPYFCEANISKTDLIIRGIIVLKDRNK